MLGTFVQILYIYLKKIKKIVVYYEQSITQRLLTKLELKIQFFQNRLKRKDYNSSLSKLLISITCSRRVLFSLYEILNIQF